MDKTHKVKDGFAVKNIVQTKDTEKLGEIINKIISDLAKNELIKGDRIC